jgi:hypothetical protein
MMRNGRRDMTRKIGNIILVAGTRVEAKLRNQNLGMRIILKSVLK